MKYTWEEKDLKNMGTGFWVCKNYLEEGQRFEACGWTSKWTYIIGWNFDDNKKRCMTSLADGMTILYTESGLLEHLNKTDMMPMPLSWQIETLEWLYDRHW